jgi:Lrp/AsnC family leucine-responsive transcriptional regulator
MKSKAVNALIGYCGAYDYEISIMAKDPAEFSSVFDSLAKDINIKAHSIATIISTLKSATLPSIESRVQIENVRNDPSFSKAFQDKKQTLNLDKIDHKLLGLLADNANLSLSELGKKVKLSSDAIAYRIRSLIRQNMIVHFRPVIDYSRLGLTIQTMLVKGRMPKIKSFLESDNNVLWCAETVGNWDYIIYVITKNSEEFHDFSRKIKENFDEHLKSYELLFAYKDYIYSFMSKNIQESR